MSASGRQQIVAIQVLNELAAHQLSPSFMRQSRSLIGVSHAANPVRVRAAERLDEPGSIVSGTIIGNDDLELAPRLRQHAVHGALQHPCPVMDGDDD